MQLRFKATSSTFSYTISGETINGIDLSPLEHGGQFVGNDDTKAAGIRHAERDSSGELWVTLQQAPPITRISFVVEGRKRPITLSPEQIERDGDKLVLHVEQNSGKVDEGGEPVMETVEVRHTIVREIEHRDGDWTESDWIDASTYDPDALYIKEV